MVILAHAATDKPVWFLFAATAVLALAALRALGQLSESKTDRHLQVLSDFGRRWDEPSLVEARTKQWEIPNDQLLGLVTKWFEHREPKDSPVPLLLRIPNYFEDLAITVDAGNLDMKIVVRPLGHLVVDMWQYWGAPIYEMRKYEPRAYIEFEALYREVRRYRANAS